jgi:hypothetical protein
MLALIFVAVSGETAMSMNPGKRYITAPEPKNPGKYVPWECSFLTDHAPPLPEEAHTLFKEARAIQKSSKHLFGK